MIIREWRGRTSPDRASAYPTHFRSNVLPELRSIAGFLGATLCRRDDGGRIEYVVLTRWQSLDAIRAFARDGADRAVVEPGAVAALTDFDNFVRHYEIIEDTASP
ncbi:MAG TPA: antibiotic biosynthesis monooxygenase [Stellaceae bacterium]|nr:antibiotic biosynthesis monooxygenase [Stellaceae bacterium]